MTLNCTVSSKLLEPESIEINPPLEALRAIGMSGVKTELNILFDRVFMASFNENVEILEQIIESLPHTQSIYIFVFQNPNIIVCAEIGLQELGLKKRQKL